MWLAHKTSIIIGLVFLLLLSAFWFLPSFAFIFFLSLLFELLLNPIVDRLGLHMPRGLAAGLVLLFTIFIVLGMLTIISKTFLPTLTSFLAELPTLAAAIQQSIITQESSLLKFGLEEAWTELTSLSTAALKSSLVLIFSLFNKLIDIVIIVFITFYLLVDGKNIKNFTANLFPAEDKLRIICLMDHILLSLQTYIRSQLSMCFITGIIVYLYFTFMGLPYASVFAVVSGISEFIPVLGPTAASCFGIVLTAAYTPVMALQTGIFYLFLTQINHNVIYPEIIGKSLKLHPIAILLGIILGGELLDTAGMFLAVPCIVVVKHVIEDIHKSTKRKNNTPA